MRRMWRVALIAGLAAGAAGAGEAQAVELVNPSFEEDANKDGLADGWRRANWAGDQRASLDRDVKKEGQCSLRLESSEPVVNNADQVVSIEPGAVYRATVWVKTRDFKVFGEKPGAATLVVRHHGGRYLYIGTGRTHKGTSDWVKETVDFIAPSKGRAVLTCMYSSWGHATGTVWFDDMRLVRLAPAGGIGALPEPPGSAHALAEWALQRKPLDTAALARALELYYTLPVPIMQRASTPLATYHKTLRGGAKADPKLQPRLIRLYGEHAWRMEPSELADDDVRVLLEKALKLAEKTPQQASFARRGLARLTALQNNKPVAEIAKALQRVIGNETVERQRVVGILLRDAADLHRNRNEAARAARLYDILLAFIGPEEPQRAGVELARLRFFQATGEREKVQQAAAELASPKREVTPSIRREAFSILVRLGVESGDLVEAQKWLRSADDQFSKDPIARATLHLDYANDLAAKERWSEATAPCLTVVASFPQATKSCFQAQRLMVRCLLEQRRHDEALAAAKVLYGASPNAEKEITEAVNLVMQGLKAKYRSIALANRFVAFQAHGPAGEDGRPGTEDDLINPLADVQWAPPADINALFKKTLEGLPEDFAGRRWRAYLYLYWGKPKLALKEFAWRFDHAPLQERAISEAIDDVVVGLKAHQGHSLIGERFMDYQKYGPEGKDGVAGSPDDLTDPLAGLLKKP